MKTRMSYWPTRGQLTSLKAIFCVFSLCIAWLNSQFKSRIGLLLRSWMTYGAIRGWFSQWEDFCIRINYLPIKGHRLLKNESCLWIISSHFAFWYYNSPSTSSKPISAVCCVKKSSTRSTYFRKMLGVKIKTFWL